MVDCSRTLLWDDLKAICNLCLLCLSIFLLSMLLKIRKKNMVAQCICPQIGKEQRITLKKYTDRMSDTKKSLNPNQIVFKNTILLKYCHFPKSSSSSWIPGLLSDVLPLFSFFFCPSHPSRDTWGREKRKESKKEKVENAV